MKKRVLSVLLAVILVVSMAIPALAAEPVATSEEPEGIWAAALNFVIHIFIPEEDYFYNRVAEVNRAVSNKFGGLAQLYQTLNGFFSSLQSAQTSGVVFNLPDDYFYDGYGGLSVNVMTGAAPYVRLLRGVLNACCCLVTAIACYHKLRSFFVEGVA